MVMVPIIYKNWLINTILTFFGSTKSNLNAGREGLRPVSYLLNRRGGGVGWSFQFSGGRETGGRGNREFSREVRFIRKETGSVGLFQTGR